MVDISFTTTDSVSDEGIIALDRDCHIMSCNDATRHLLGVDVYPGDVFTPERVWTGQCLQKIKATLEMVLESG